jgi:MoaA/NifB/PqqE/SkfB family radical SAM enzyme
MRTRKTLRFEVYLLYHCNLNCAGCAVFSPIAKEEYLDTACYEQDCKRLSELTDGKAECIRLMGGEPTLHPNMSVFFNITRRYFKTAEIQLVTNGISLNKQDDNFWETCGKNNIKIQISKYPIKIDMDGISEKGKSKNVAIEITESKADEMFHLKLDIEGKQDSVDSFNNCWVKNSCITLSKGRLYTCSIIPAVEHFNSYFSKELTVKGNDGIDIYKTNTIKEIFEFLTKPIGFCHYCNMKGMIYGQKWHISQKEMEEWT